VVVALEVVLVLEPVDEVEVVGEVEFPWVAVDEVAAALVEVEAAALVVAEVVAEALVEVEAAMVAAAAVVLRVVQFNMSLELAGATLIDKAEAALLETKTSPVPALIVSSRAWKKTAPRVGSVLFS